MKNEVLRNVGIKARKTLALMSLLVLLGAGGAFAQVTMGVGSLTAKVGDTVNVPISVTNFNNVGAISIKLGYNSAATQFVGVTGAPTGVSFTSNAVGGVITLGWFDATTTTPINLGTGVLVNLRVVYKGGTGAFTINGAQSEIASSAGVAIPVTYSGGSVSPIALGVTIGSAQGKANTIVTIPVTVTNFTAVGAVSMKIQYDPAVLQFDSVANPAASMSFTKGAAGGVITLGWFDQTGNTPVTIAAGKLLDLKFTYKGGTSALTVVTGQSEIANSTGVVFAVQYANGTVSPAPGEILTLNLPDVSLATGSSTVLPLMVEKFSGVGAISVKISYNAAVLTFNSISNAAASSMTANASNGVLTLAWFDATGSSPLTIGTAGTGKLADLNFTYNGGNSALSFVEAQTEIATITGTKIAAAFKSGSVSLNVKPTFDAIAPITAKEQDTVKFVVNAVDPNAGTTLTYTAGPLPQGATFTAATKTFLWVPALNTANTYTVKFYATDGVLKDSVSAIITVTKNNVKPVFVSKTPATRADIQKDYAHSVVFKVTASDPNKEPLIYAWYLNGALQQSGSDSSYDAKGKWGALGAQKLVCVFSDAAGLKDSTTWTFAVVPTATGVEKGELGIPTEFSLGQNYPNPFNPSTMIKFALPKAAPVTLEIYNILGAKVRTLLSGAMMSAAYHNVEWNGRNDAGMQVTSGMYLYRIVADNHVATMKMMLMK